MATISTLTLDFQSAAYLLTDHPAGPHPSGPSLGVWAVLRNPLTPYNYQWRPYKRAIAGCRRVMAASMRVKTV